MLAPPSGDPTALCTYDSACTEGATDLVTDGTSIFWSDGAANVYGCAAATTCPAKRTYATSASIPETTTALAWDGANLVLGTAPGGSDGTAKIYACTPERCSQSPSPLAREPAVVGRIFATAAAIYWIADDDPALDAGAAHAFRVMRLAK